MADEPLVLGIETSCDETGVAVYDTTLPGAAGVRAHAVYSQIALHAEYGGVVPELASRDHVRKLLPLVRQTLAEEWLSGSSLSVEHIAEMLGYAEATSFINAFKRWAGRTPHAYRLGKRVGGAPGR